MADNRKYYYLKLKEDFFDTDEMKILESMKDGYLYSNILLKLYLKSLSNSGRLMYRNVIPYTPEILATLTGHQVGTVEKALDVFKKLDLIEMICETFNSQGIPPLIDINGEHFAGITEYPKEAISNWSGGKVINIVKSDEVTESDLAMMKSAAARLNDNIEKAQTAAGKPAGEGDDPEVDTEDKKDQGKKKQSKGDNEDMKIDKSKMTQAELIILEDIEKRYGVADDPAQTEQTPEGKPAVTKSVEKPEQNQETPADGEDIYKGLNPAVKAEIEALRKFREDAENRELEAVAGKYEIIGKKKEELVPMLKSLRATGGTAYNDMIAVLDATVEAVNKSGVFSEVGKSGHGSAHVSDAEGKIEGIAKSYMQKEPSMSYTDALANLNVLAQLFEIDRIVLDRTVQNKAGLGQNADMGYIGDPNSFLLAYATDTPSVEEPSAGYIFTWDMLENGILLPILNYPGAPGTHSELVEGLMAYDMKKTADDLAFFGCDAV